MICWQPIDTAPKDGTLIIVYSRGLLGHHECAVDIVAWNAESNAWIDAINGLETDLEVTDEWITHFDAYT